ncbi:ABC transporter substrate-binding protein [Microbacterium betulae]|uniref:ABC transporter substrate-binding protein n=1 Tax=Microbacterium betulae TaxID=2981139 RepID=A0AA97FIY4_9MICO|nr:ABC transporter substrate-binding protein [Microbacterium sp. AB]WOF24026.1 ABC transporter substrate-binding protein [Microbacterium sp. AB]
MHSTTARRTVWPALAATSALALVLAGCADTAPPEGEADSVSSGIFPAELVEAATARATEIADGAELDGTTVTMIGTWGGSERERFLATLEPFEEATGVTVEFTGTEDYQSVIQSGVDSGNPIDVAAASSLGIVHSYAESGDLVDLNELIGEEALASGYGDGFLSSTSVDGGNYGLWSMVDNYMVWYDPGSYEGPTGTDVTWDEVSAYADELSGSGTAPWCMGLSAGANTGWPGAYFVLDLLLKDAGPDFVEALGTGDAAWDSPEVRTAFDRFSAVVADASTVSGGPDGALSTDPGAAGAGMYTDPAQCELMHWGTFTAAIVLASDESLEPVDDLDFLLMPTIDPAYADAQGYAGTILSAFSDRPEVAALMTYLASSEHANLIAATGNWTSPNTGTDAASYPNEILAKVATEILSSEDLVPFPTVVSQSDVTAAIYRTTAEFVQDPSTLDDNLATLDELVAGS